MANPGFKKKENRNKQTKIIIPSSSLKSNDWRVKTHLSSLFSGLCLLEPHFP